MKKLIAVLALGSLTFAVDAPQITPEQRAAFWRANAEALAAQVQLERSQQKLRDLQAKLVETCGEKQQLTTGPNGEPMCQPKPNAQ